MLQLSTRLEPRVPPWGLPSGLGHNLQIPRSTSTRFLNYKFSEIQVFYGQVHTRMPFKRRKCYSPTSRQARVLVVQASATAYLQDLPSRFFFLWFAQCKKGKNSYRRATYKGNFSRVLNQEFLFFLFTSSGVHKQPISFESLAPASLFLQGSHVQRQYWKWTTLRSESSTIKGLLYAPDPHNCKKGTLSDQPWLLRISSMALLCCWGRSCSKIWHPLWLTLRCMPYGRGTLRVPLHRICSEEGPHYPLEQSMRKLSQDNCQSTYSRVWKSLGDSIPELYCIAWLGLGNARKCVLGWMANLKQTREVNGDVPSQGNKW